MCFGYLDDFTSGGPASTVAQDLEFIASNSSNMDLDLNMSKCELISDTPSKAGCILDSFIHVKPEQATLLGAPLFLGTALNDTIDNFQAGFTRASKRLSLISAHDAIIILRNSLSAPKFAYVLSSSPCAGHPGLVDCDHLLRESLSSVVNCQLSDSQWLQACLPISMGGFGVRSVSSLAPSAFLASAAGSR